MHTSRRQEESTMSTYEEPRVSEEAKNYISDQACYKETKTTNTPLIIPEGESGYLCITSASLR